MRHVTERALQEYFETLAKGDTGDSTTRARDLITSYAELKFRREGGGRCQTCRATVRHVLPVAITRADGTKVQFNCLCHRCLEGERATAQSVEITLGLARWVVKKTEPSQRDLRKKRA